MKEGLEIVAGFKELDFAKVIDKGVKNFLEKNFPSVGNIKIDTETGSIYEIRKTGNDLKVLIYSFRVYRKGVMFTFKKLYVDEDKLLFQKMDGSWLRMNPKVILSARVQDIIDQYKIGQTFYIKK